MEEISYRILKNVMVDGNPSPMWVYKLDENDPLYEFDTLEEAEAFSATYAHLHRIVKWVNGTPVN